MTQDDTAPDQQLVEEYGGQTPEDEAHLHEHGYPKLGKSPQSRMTQVEHGPYAGGTQQGDVETPEKVAQRAAE